MSFLNLFKSSGKKAVTEGERGFIMLLEKLGMDDVVDDAQISKYEEALTKVSQMAAKAKDVYDADKAASDKLSGDYDTKIGDATKLQTAIEECDGKLQDQPNDEALNSRRKKLDAHLSALLSEVEGMKPTLDDKAQATKDSKDHYGLLKEMVELKAGQLAHVKDALTKARRENQNLDVQKQRIHEREKEQKEVLGIRENTDAVDSILGAINADSAKKRQDIEASRMRVDALQHQIKPSTESDIDPEVAEVLGKGGTAQPAQSNSDRLAALKRK